MRGRERQRQTDGERDGGRGREKEREREEEGEIGKWVDVNRGVLSVGIKWLRATQLEM